MNNTTTLVTRRIPVTLLNTAENLHVAVKILISLPSMQEVAAGSRGKSIEVRYDAAALQFPALLAALNAEHLLKSPGWWTALQFVCYGYMDRNTRDMASVPASPCCSNPFPNEWVNRDKR